MSFYRFTLAIQDLSMPVHGAGGKLVIGPFLGETLEGCLVAGFFLLAESLVVAELQPMKVCIHEGIGILVLLMKPK